MELENVLHFLENKAILVTGGTGFLAKILVEKILRVQPNVKKLYLLLRASDAKSAAQRLHDEVIEKEVFRVLKEKWGDKMYPFISEKIIPVAGDICCKDLGIEDSDLKEEIWNQVDVIVNLAATTNFDERYDIALNINTFGAKHVLEFAKKCTNINVIVHVSTAYVAGERKWLIQEKPYHMGDTLNEASGLDIRQENRVVETRLEELIAQGCTEKEITCAMKDLGLQRAKMHGWPNTYVFTKAMGEMIMGQSKENLSVVILRPTIVTSTYKEPFPGWLEGVRTIDSIVVAYAKGRLTTFVCKGEGIVDLIPADMVVNSMIMAMVAHANKPSEAIYQVGSSLRNPMTYNNLHKFGFHYFTNKPFITRDGEAIKVGKINMWGNFASFRGYIAFRYLLPIKVLQVANVVCCHYFQESCSKLSRKINTVMRLIELYRPYLFFEGVFDDINTQKLEMAARNSGIDMNAFYFDPKCIDWEDYFLNAHLPGLVKYVMM